MGQKKKPKVLVLATSRLTHGGISTVVAAHSTTSTWSEYRCRWIATHRSGSKLRKLLYMAKGLGIYMLCLPGADIVHIHTSHLPSALRKLIFLRLARLAGKKTVVHFHADVELTIVEKHIDHYRSLFKRADIIVVLHQNAKDSLSRLFPEMEDRIRVVYNPSPHVETTEPMPTARHGYKTILYAGIVSPAKGYDVLIKAFAKVAADFPDWRLVIAGNGETRQAGMLAKELGVADRVDFPGWVTGDEKHRLFSEASVFCLPSLNEGFPMVVLEAWAYGLPVVATPAGGLGEVAVDGDNILFVRPGDADQLAENLRRLMDDENFRKKIGSESNKLAESEFNIEDISSDLEIIYHDLSK